MKIKIMATLSEEDIRHAIEDWFVTKDVRAETIAFKLLGFATPPQAAEGAAISVEAEVEGTWISSEKSS